MIISDKLYSYARELVSENYSHGKSIFIEDIDKKDLLKLTLLAIEDNEMSVLDGLCEFKTPISSLVINLFKNQSNENKINFSDLLLENIFNYFKYEFQELFDRINNYYEQEYHEESGHTFITCPVNGESRWVI